MRRTKIVCTLGPATNDVEVMKQLIRNGLDAARINFSHGTYETHGEIIQKLKQARRIGSANSAFVGYQRSRNSDKNI